MIRTGGPGMILAAALAASTVGCSTQKYNDQIEQQKIQITELQQKNYQLETEMGKAKTAAGPTEAGAGAGTDLGGETAGVSFEGGRRSGGEEIAERIVLDSEVLFNSGSATLSRKGNDALRSVVSQLAKFAGRTIRVDGHTDDVPTRKTKDKFPTNWELSALRACAVARYLTEEGGIPAKNVYVAGFADHRPRASNASPDGRAKNRRVEITVLQ